MCWPSHFFCVLMIEYLNFNDFMNYTRLSISDIFYFRKYVRYSLGDFMNEIFWLPSFWFKSHPFYLQIEFFWFYEWDTRFTANYTKFHPRSNEFAICNNIEKIDFLYMRHETRNMIIDTKPFIFNNIEAKWPANHWWMSLYLRT